MFVILVLFEQCQSLILFGYQLSISSCNHFDLAHSSVTSSSIVIWNISKMALPAAKLSLFIVLAVFSFINFVVYYNYINRKYMSRPVFPHPLTNISSLNLISDQKPEMVDIRVPAHRQVVNMFDSHKYKIISSKVCPEKINETDPPSILMLICVCSALNNFDTRKAIRETWGRDAVGVSDSNKKIILLFFVGKSLNLQNQLRLGNESVTYDDIVQTDFIDAYRNLTLKSASMLKWASEFCTSMTYMVKIDDDCFLNVPYMLEVLDKDKEKRRKLFGFLMKAVRPVRDDSSKYFVSKFEYPMKIYPNYLSGSCYIMSGDIATNMYNVCISSVPFISMEDIFVTGFCAAKMKVSPRHDKQFVHWKLPANGCEYQNKIMGHFLKAKDFYQIWNDLEKLRNKTYKCVRRPKILKKPRS
ncbi:B3GALT1 (predicted) [Pycnogonum litorale]